MERAQRWARGALTFGCLYLVLQFGVTQWSLSQFVEAIEKKDTLWWTREHRPPHYSRVLRHGRQFGRREIADEHTGSMGP